MICWFLAKALIALRINVLQHFWEKAAAASLTKYYQGCFWMTSLPRWFAVGPTMSSKLLIYGCVNFALQLKLLFLANQKKLQAYYCGHDARLLLLQIRKRKNALRAQNARLSSFSAHTLPRFLPYPSSFIAASFFSTPALQSRNLQHQATLLTHSYFLELYDLLPCPLYHLTKKTSRHIFCRQMVLFS